MLEEIFNMTTNAALNTELQDMDPEAMTRMIMRLFEHWALSYEQQANMLSLSTKSRSTIANYKRGSSSVSQDRDTRDRVAYFLAIHQLLRNLFPLNKELAYAWPTSTNQYFLGQSPVEVITNEGLLGLVKVFRYLENVIEH